MIRAEADRSASGLFHDRVRVAAVADRGEYRAVYNHRDDSLTRVDESAMLPEGPWALDLPSEIARAVYEALRAHYGDADLEPLRVLTAAREHSEDRRTVAEDALREIALSTVRSAA